MAKPHEEKIIDMAHKIKSKGVFNLEDLYVEMQLWFTHMGYTWHEAEYRHIALPGGKGYRLEIIWIAEKAVDDYSDFYIKLIMGIDASDVEVVLDDGKKVKRQKATIEIRSGAIMIRHQERFNKMPFGLSGISIKLYELMIRPRIRQQETDLWTEANKLYDELKAFMMLFPH